MCVQCEWYTYYLIIELRNEKPDRESNGTERDGRTDGGRATGDCLQRKRKSAQNDCRDECFLFYFSHNHYRVSRKYNGAQSDGKQIQQIDERETKEAKRLTNERADEGKFRA